MSDEFVYNKSISSNEEIKPYSYKGWEYINDTNQNNYSSGQVIITTESIANSGSLPNYEEAVIKVPLCLCITAEKGGTRVDMTTIKAEYITGLKSGYHNLLASVNIEYNNGSLIQQTAFSNVYASYKINTSFSQGDLETVGPTIGIPELDGCDSWVFRNDQPTSFGVGSCNNNNANTTFKGSDSQMTNQISAGNLGFIKRLMSDNMVLDTSNVVANSLESDLKTGMNQISNDSKLVSSGLNRVVSVGGTNSYTCIFITATIRLKDLPCDIFQKMPPCYGAIFKFTLNFNLPSFSVTKLGCFTANALANPRLLCEYKANTNTAGEFYATQAPSHPLLTFDPSSYIAPGSSTTNPVMISSCFTDNSLAGTNLSSVFGVGTDTATTITNYNASAIKFNVSLSIGKPTNIMHSSISVSQPLPVRLYVPLLTLNPNFSSEYLKLGQKKFNYTDVFSFQPAPIEPSANFSLQIAYGLKNIQRVIIVPFISAKSNCLQKSATTATVIKDNYQMNSFSPLISPFASEGATTSPFIGSCLSEFNCKIGGKNILSTNLKYGWEVFEQQLMGTNSINGGMTTGLTSGLINERMWNSNYQYYVFDCSRFTENLGEQPLGIELVGINNTLVALDLHVFVEIKKEFIVDLSTGARL